MTEDPEGDALIEAIGNAVNAARAHTFPRLVIESVTDDGETYLGMRCPRCGGLVSDNENSLASVDWSMHWQVGQSIDMDAHTITFYPDDHDLDDTVYYLHNEDHVVSLPEGFSEDWS